MRFTDIKNLDDLKMKYYKSILAIVCIGLFWSCQPPVVFSEPQPKGIEELTSIPKHFQGTYWCANDSVILHIDKILIYKNKLYDVTLTPQ